MKEVAMSEHDSTCALPALPNVTGVQFRHVENAPGYCVGDDGTVWSCKRQVGVKGRKGACCHRTVLTDDWRQLSSTQSNSGYLKVSFHVGGKLITPAVHRLVLGAFVGKCPDGMEGCHSDGDRLNNALNNLRWATPLDNAADKRRHGTVAAPGAKLTPQERETAIGLVLRGHSTLRIAEWFGVSRSAIQRAARQ
jgi:hypothetical protein